MQALLISDGSHKFHVTTIDERAWNAGYRTLCECNVPKHLIDEDEEHLKELLDFHAEVVIKTPTKKAYLRPSLDPNRRGI